MQKGNQEKVFKNRPKSSPRLNGPKAHWRKWHYPLSSTHLKCKDGRTFWFKQRLQKFPNGQVMGIFARSFKTSIFWKSSKGGPREIFNNRPRDSLRLKGLKALWRKWHYKVPEWQRYGKFCKVTLNPHFLKKCKRGTKENFSKIFQKVDLLWKAQKHTCANGIIL